jgi:purine nucleosidase
MRLIIDTDAGVDDAQAIMLALTDPNVTVEAITTVTGNAHVSKVVPNVCTILDIMKTDVPVFKGAEQPLLHPWHPEEAYHGLDGMGDWNDRPSTPRQPEHEHAVQALLRLANTYPGELTLIALGPLTNLALAIRLDPSFPEKIKQFVFMGGTIAAHGNTPSVTAEWNIYCDPEAAHIVLQAFPLSTMLSWETTLQHTLTWEQCDELVTMDSAAARLFQGISQSSLDFLRHHPSPHGYLLPDPLAMAVTLKPTLAMRVISHFVSVELHGTYTRGQTVVDYVGLTGKNPNVSIVTAIDMNGVFDLFKRALA